jgi:hypothetical protein
MDAKSSVMDDAMILIERRGRFRRAVSTAELEQRLFIGRSVFRRGTHSSLALA